MLLVHTPRLTNRLGYTLNVLFRHVFRVEFSITTDAEHYAAFEGAKMNYGARRLEGGVFVKSAGLLFETSIEEQDVRCSRTEEGWRIFPVYGQDLDMEFDVLSAIFYMVSRYEEYLPHRVDEHQRFCATDSVAFQEGFLEEPVVEQWAYMLRDRLVRRFPDEGFAERQYRFVQTVDIDAAWCYLHKGVFRTLTGGARDMVSRGGWEKVAERWRVLTHQQADPYDTFDYILEVSGRAAGSYLLFFTLLADYDQYDKPISYFNPHMRELLQHLGDHAKMGVHPGYYSLEQPSNTDAELKRLEDILHRKIVRSRFHFLRLTLPRSYRILLHSGIRHDYTMGYAEAAGFRAGISCPYTFYDLERDMETELTIHPFCVMDTTLKKYMGLSPEAGREVIARLVQRVKAVGGTFCSIVHNQNISETDGWQGWRATYEYMIDIAKP